MKYRILPLSIFLSFLFIGCGCTCKSSYFGVKNRAFIVPEEFANTEAAVEQAEKSAGARYCPEKIREAKELGRRAAEIYWACDDEKAMGLLARAADLAGEAESCTPPPTEKPVPPKEKPAPAKTIPTEPKTPTIQWVVIEQAFEFDCITLTRKATKTLERQAAALKQHPQTTIEIYGHADSRGTQRYNQSLSERRAETAKAYLVSAGVAANRMRTFGKGERDPRCSNDTEAGRFRNRRIELKIIGMK